jgi:CRISPR system Cascade subunit CasB
MAKRPARDAGRAAFEWWKSLQRYNSDGKPHVATADPGALARLRRAATPVEAWQSPQTARLFRMLYGLEENFHADKANAVGVLAATLSHVRKDEREKDGRPQRTARLLGAARVKGSDQPLMSDLRMRRLCAARDPVEVMRGFREAVLLLDSEVPVADLAASVLDWTAGERGEWRRIRWLFDYHDAGGAAPAHDQSQMEATR